MREPLSKINPKAAAVGTTLKADIVRLRDLPPSDRGDVSNDLAQLNNRMMDFENTLHAGQVTIDGLRNHMKLTSLAAKVSTSVSNDPMKTFFGKETIAFAQSLLGRVNDLKSSDLEAIYKKQDEVTAVIQELQN